MKMNFKDKGFETKDKDWRDFGRSYLSVFCPNPDRQGCPPDAALRAIAFNPRESQSGVTEHLASCSPCFRRYGELLAELKSEREREKGFTWSSISAWTKAHPVFVGTA